MSEEIIERIGRAFEAMQRDYDELARHYGFTCQGCMENCCTQRFAHHTLAEYVFLREGLMRAGLGLRRRIVERAAEAVRIIAEDARKGVITPVMCPANEEGKCVLYEHRPMICRLHGLPHAFRRPDGREERGGGCGRFEAAHKTDWTLKRTSHYNELARIEALVRQRRLFKGKYARTTAGMIMDIYAEQMGLPGSEGK